MAEEAYATYIESRGIRRYFKDKRYKEPLILVYDYNQSPPVLSGYSSDNPYEDIIDAIAAGRDVKCQIICGNSTFRADLRRIYHGDGQETPFVSFDYRCFNTYQTSWWGQVKIYENGDWEYSEGTIESLEI